MSEVASDGVAGSRRRIAAGAAWTAAAAGWGVVANFGSLVLLVHVMSATDYGVFATALSAATLACVVTGLGLAQALPQVGTEQSAVRGAAGLSRTVAIAVRIVTPTAVVIGAVSALALTIAASVGAGGDLVLPLAVLAPTVAIAPVTAALSGLLRATYRPGALTAASITSGAVLAGVTVVLVLAGQRSAVAMSAARLGAVAASTIVLLGTTVAWRRGSHACADTDRGVAASDGRAIRRRLTVMSGAMLLAGVFTTAISQLDVLLLGLLRGADAAARYQPASRFIDLCLLVPGFAGTFFLPEVTAAAARSDHATVRALYQWATRWNVVVCAPMLGLALVCPDSVLHVLFGAGFDAPITATRVLGAGVAVHVLLGLNGLTLDAYARARLVTVRLAVALAVDVLACLVLVPASGVEGAALATALGLVTANVLCSAELLVRYRTAPWSVASAVTAGGFGAALGAAWAVSASLSSDAARCVVVVAVTGAVTLASCLFAGGSDERRRVASALSTLLPVRSASRSGPGRRRVGGSLP